MKNLIKFKVAVLGIFLFSFTVHSTEDSSFGFNDIHISSNDNTATEPATIPENSSNENVQQISDSEATNSQSTANIETLPNKPPAQPQAIPPSPTPEKIPEPEIKNQIIALCSEAQANFNSMNFHRALILYQSALEKNPEKVGLAEIKPKILGRIRLIRKIEAAQRYSSRKLSEAEALYNNKKYNESKAVLKQLYARLSKTSTPSYFSSEFARIREILSKLKNAQIPPQSQDVNNNTETRLNLRFINLSAYQYKVGDRNTVMIQGSYIVSGLSPDEKYNFIVLLKGEWGAKTSLSEGYIGNGKYKFKGSLDVDSDFRPGVKLVTATVLCSEKNISRTRNATVTLLKGERNPDDTLALLHFITSNSEEDSRTDADSPVKNIENNPEEATIDSNSRTTSVTNQVSEESDTESNIIDESKLVKVNIISVHLNQDSYRPGETLTMKVVFRVKNADKNTTFTIYGNIDGIGSFTRNLSLNNGKHSTTFQFIVPDLPRHIRPIQVKIKWRQNNNEYKVSYKRKKTWKIRLPEIFSAVISLKPKVLTPGCKVKFRGEIYTRYFKPNTTLKLMAKFSSGLFKKQPPSKYINFQASNYTGKDRKDFYLEFKVPDDIKLGNYKISIQVKAKQGKYLIGPKIGEKEFTIQKYSYTVYKYLNKSTKRESLLYCSYNMKNMNSKYEKKYVLARYFRNKSEAIRYILERIKNIRKDSKGNYFGYDGNKKYYVSSSVANYGKSKK